MTLRRPLKDASGRPVFDLRRKIGWLVEDASGNLAVIACDRDILEMAVMDPYPYDGFLLGRMAFD
jgi:hypothetical protein